MYDIERIYYPQSVAEAVQMLKKDPEALVICGGSDVLVQIREGKLAGCRLVSIQGLSELHGIALEGDGDVVIRPGTTFAEVTESPIIARHVPALGHATNQAGGPQLRNVGTIGGNLCNGVTSADSAATLLTLNAQLQLTGPGGVRWLALENFYKGPGKVDLQPGELLTAILIKQADYSGFGGHYIKYAQRNAMDIATLGCAVHVKLNDAKTHVEELRLAFGVAAPTPVRCHQTEAMAAGQPLGEALYRAVGQSALGEVAPRSSWRASKAFREQLVRELSGRALRQAAAHAGGDVL